MFDIEKILSEYGLTPEKYEELLKECSDKVHKISDCDWIEIANKYNINMNSDTIRKAQQPPLFGGTFVKEYFQWKESHNKFKDDDVYFKEMQLQKDEIYKEKRKLYDQRREYNKLLISDARADHLTEELIKCANSLNESRPLEISDDVIVDTNNDAIMLWADWHYGMVTDNIWNTYNTEICRQRLITFVNKSIERLELHKVNTLYIVLLGDSCHGGIHNSARIKSEEDACDQLMHVSELMAEAINILSHHVNKVEFWSTYGNHMRTIQDKKDSIHSDNMEKIVPWWIEQRLQNNPKVEVKYSEFKEFTKLNVCGYNVCCVHGDLEKGIKNLGVTVNTIFTKKYGCTIDYTISADKHHLEEFESFDIDNILIRSMCGTDDYANGGRLYSNAGQTLLIFNEENGRDATYHIKLN